jgi:glutaredoxin-like protein
MAVIKDEDRKHLEKLFGDLHGEVKLVYFTQEIECQYCELTHNLVDELVELSPKLSLDVHDLVKDEQAVKKYGIDKIPALVVEGKEGRPLKFFGIPAGYEFTTLVEDIMEVSKGKPDLPDELASKVAELRNPVHIQVFVSPTCPYCPDAVRAAHKLALASDKVTADMVEISEFPELAVKYEVQGVPKTVINEKHELVGAQPVEELVEKVLEAAGEPG